MTLLDKIVDACGCTAAEAALIGPNGGYSRPTQTTKGKSMSMKYTDEIGSIRIHAHDELTKLDDGSYRYTDASGETVEIGDEVTLYTWLANEQIELTAEIEALIAA